MGQFSGVAGQIGVEVQYTVGQVRKQSVLLGSINGLQRKGLKTTPHNPRRSAYRPNPTPSLEPSSLPQPLDFLPIRALLHPLRHNKYNSRQKQTPKPTLPALYSLQIDASHQKDSHSFQSKIVRIGSFIDLISTTHHFAALGSQPQHGH